MPAITKSELKYEYKWSVISPDDPRITGKPDTTFLSRHEGYEVLSFVNSFAEKHKAGRGVALKAERLINEHLPANVKGRGKVAEWLEANWDKYQ